MRRSSIVTPVLVFELDVGKRNEYGQWRRITSVHEYLIKLAIGAALPNVNNQVIGVQGIRSVT